MHIEEISVSSRTLARLNCLWGREAQTRGELCNFVVESWSCSWVLEHCAQLQAYEGIEQNYVTLSLRAGPVLEFWSMVHHCMHAKQLNCFCMEKKWFYPSPQICFMQLLPQNSGHGCFFFFNLILKTLDVAAFSSLPWYRHDEPWSSQYSSVHLRVAVTALGFQSRTCWPRH